MLVRRHLLQTLGLVAATSMVPRTLWAGSGNSGLATPPPEFASNSNYLLYGGGQPIRGLKVTIAIEEDIIAPGAMSLQLNVNSPAVAKCVYQQYCTALDPTWGEHLGIGWSIENFPSTGFRETQHQNIGLPCLAGSTPGHCKGDLYNYPPTKAAFAKFEKYPSDRIPAGFRIIHELIDDPQTGSIVAANYTVVSDTGERFSANPRILGAFKFRGTETLVGHDGVAPNYAFQLNMCGLHGGEHTQLTSGAGSITYEAATPMTAQGQQSALIGAYTGTPGTVETSNLVYSELPVGASLTFVQRFARKGHLSNTPAGAAATSSSNSSGTGPESNGSGCPPGQTFNSLTKSCEAGHGRTIDYDQAPPSR
jgi:hypothetical protein